MIRIVIHGGDQGQHILTLLALIVIMIVDTEGRKGTRTNEDEDSHHIHTVLTMVNITMHLPILVQETQGLRSIQINLGHSVVLRMIWQMKITLQIPWDFL